MTDTERESTSGSGRPDSGLSQPTKLPKPRCKLVGTDGNVFSIIGRGRRALELDGQPDRARTIVKRASASRSYDETLALCLEYVEVE